MHWNKLEWVDPKSTPKRVMAYSVSSKSSRLIIIIEQLILLVILNLKELDVDDFYKCKQTNEEREAEMNEMDVKHGKKAYSDHAKVDEEIPIQIRKERTTEAY